MQQAVKHIPKSCSTSYIENAQQPEKHSEAADLRQKSAAT